MGFANVYRSRQYKNNSRELPSSSSTILPFFGFHCTYERETKHRLRGGETVISKNSIGDYEVRKAPTFWDSDTYECAVFRRSYEPIGKERELEDKFYDLTSSRYSNSAGQYNVFDTPSLFGSAEEFYKFKKTPISVGGFIVDGFFVMLLFCILYTVIAFAMPDAGLLLIDSNYNVEIPPFFPPIGIGVWVLFVVVGLIVQKCVPQAPSYDKLSQKRKLAIRNEYFKTFNVYGKAAKQVLIEYAILTGKV